VALLNLDAGEHDDEPEELWELADVLSIACGGHAGDERSMTRVVAFCARRERPRIGAHPSYPDREGFGRRRIDIEPDLLRESIAAQCRALATVAAAHGRAVEYVKPHGALYHDAIDHLDAASAVLLGARAAFGEGVAVIGPPSGRLADIATSLGVRYLREGFADRATCPDGTLVPRSDPGALITDPTVAAARATELASRVDTICIHGDTPSALAIARGVRDVLGGRRSGATFAR
jgi:5-oxoprolinase (ATP-hydrolysing) subunit A